MTKAASKEESDDSQNDSDGSVRRPGSGQDVDDFSSLCEGDVDPTLNKEIVDLVDGDSDYIVYLDREYYVEWSTGTEFERWDEKNFTKRFGNISNQKSELEAFSLGVLTREQRRPFARILAESMARILGDNDEAAAIASLKMAKAYLHARSVENARLWYVGTALRLGGAAAFLAVATWLFRISFVGLVGQGAFIVILSALIGAVGAATFVIARSKEIKTDAGAGPRIHRVESLSRVMMGGCGGLLVSLAIKGGIVGSGTISSQSLAAVLAAAFVSGFSERFVPSLIQRVEGSVTANGTTGD